MPPNRQPQSAFDLFKIDFEKRQEANNKARPSPETSKYADAAAEWSAMTPQQKGPYVSRAKDAKVKNSVTEVKYTSHGVPIPLIEKLEKKKQEFEDAMNNYIIATVSNAQNKDSLMSKKFYFIHVNFLCCVELPNKEKDFIPVEFAVAEFSLKDGVQLENTYHEIIDISVPKGETCEAVRRAAETHGIGIDQTSIGEKNFHIMFEKLKVLMKPEIINDKLPPLYTTAGIKEVVPGLLSRMAESAGQSVDLFRVYSIETLFYNIRNASAAMADEQDAKNSFPELSLAHEEIMKDRFDRAPGIACQFHTEIEGSSVHCSLSIVVRWAYIICDFCCTNLDIKMKPGIHCPFEKDDYSFVKTAKKSLKYKNDSVCGLASETGVTEAYRQKTSERTYREDQERRKNCRPLEIIDHGKVRDSEVSQVKREPEPKSSVPSYSNSMQPKQNQWPRAPRAQSYAAVGAERTPELGESDFPPIGGRGAGRRKKF